MDRNKLTLKNAELYSGAELLDLYGSDILDQLRQLRDAAVRRDDDAQVAMLDLRRLQIEAILGI